ncbi:RNA pyrophosphohydrolase [Campylobacter ureolyticus RIGS 9880]|jgi:RNA pyrophosphohydrolase|uniref:RNA pyrophosphohydrolase n=3 Tax=Campylobacter ureolyticus TaxID=827 RepID=A0A2I1NB72_9BACT|nr:RNA pyrophosphohydrolase [Campylobacter ureolyticus]AKT90667.1 RNA pyrophosphohydrolase [Campylobacter ureolyticus RIGS 9880]MCR8684873.1 RNA pyrophosphohydrolase [Campylobacter ureolyticus]MCZ6103638.1 RNA pyrophosphohydrolase [Campylobacter ureolyticus]MCZ6111848.1 RNA pyrophosphohydrolase [Campylobacter ureolyticus]MCZ6116439.1 RNA pyrophosphohydrolase [Campylobacter ureolyticus]
MEKNYRPNVAAIIMSSLYPFEMKFFLAKRVDIKDAWQFPQGGIDKGETPKMALFRELKEEIGTDKVEIIAEYPKWLSYDFPEDVLEKMKPYSGQIQKYFLVRLKKNAKIKLNTEIPEFNDYNFVSFDEIDKNVRSFKRESYLEVLNYFKDKGYI